MVPQGRSDRSVYTWAESGCPTIPTSPASHGAEPCLPQQGTECPLLWLSTLPSRGCFFLPSQVALSNPELSNGVPRGAGTWMSWVLGVTKNILQDVSFPQLGLSPCLTTIPSLFLVNHLFTM